MSYGPGPTLAGTFAVSGTSSVAPLANSGMADGSDDCLGGGGPSGGDPSSGDGSSCSNPNAPGSSGPGSGNGNIYADDYISKSAPGPILPLGVGEACPPTTGVPSGCVVPATRIALFPEGCMAAGEVQEGDLLLTRLADGTLAGEVATDVRTSTQPCILLETEEGRRLHCSLSHEIMVADPAQPQGKRTLVSQLTLADRLLTEDGTPVTLTRITLQAQGGVVQISLAGPAHLYLSDGLWSHNKITPGWPGS